ncbi:serine/threonine-protein kinase [Paludisphaera borealis]|uniref:non-specific serine/threonine protein kinase n=1 Tax=Paludisphaera borealis TaxID=1387353 RepID=A0A1U7CTN3_9BACT|nr:serine/threonine-protein kinase [Paludisphaera borealis]APW62310.1 Serine/threonine-protein kinase PknB [Paludisphaera borealis]
MTQPERPRSSAIEPPPIDDADAALLVGLIDSLCAAARQGEEPDVETLAQSHPRIADELRSLWATIWVAETLAFADRPEPRIEEVDDHDELGRFGEYLLLDELGQGGMGVVFRAREPGRDRIVALKRLLRGLGSSPRDVERFRAEATAASHLAHPHIVPVFRVGDHAGQPYFTMQYVEGTTLASRLAEGPMPESEAARLLVPICRAIQYAHEQGVLHRDLKPSNILLDRGGHPYVSDFGLAKRLDLDGDLSLTPTGAILGTPGYMPPEQARDARRTPLGPACDVYSLGAILYQMLTGRPPFQAASPIETILLVLEHDPVPPRVLNPGVSPDLEMIALRCLQKQPELRYPTAGALADDLEAFLRDEPVSARSMSLRALASRLLGESHHAAVLENWGQLWIYHSVALLFFFGVTNALHLAGVTDRLPYVLLFTVGLGAWAAFFWSLRRKGGPISFVERQLAHIWGSGIVAINLVFLVEWLLGLPVLSLSPMIAVTNGMLFMTKAGILSGFYYFQAAAVFLAVFPMAWYPRYAPIIFGVVAGACFFVTGLKYKLRRQRGA